MVLGLICMLSAFAAPEADTPTPTATTESSAEPVVVPSATPPTAETFGCLKTWEAVGNTRYHSTTGQLDSVLAIARGESEGPFPAGTVVQLMPTEAMAKLNPGTSPETDDWEYLKLKVGRTGVEIDERGGAEVKNLAGSCHGCHTTEPRWDHVCGADHGCKPLPKFIVKAALKAVDKDPRCQ